MSGNFDSRERFSVSPIQRQRPDGNKGGGYLEVLASRVSAIADRAIATNSLAIKLHRRSGRRQRPVD